MQGQLFSVFEIEESHEPSAFLDSNIAVFLSSETILITNGLRGLDRWKQLVFFDLKGQAARDAAHAWTVYRYQVEHRLLTSIATHQGLASLSVDRSVQIAALLYYNTTAFLCYPSHTMIAQVLARHLRDSLQANSVSITLTLLPELHLWMLFVGAVVVEGRKLDSWF